MAVSRFPEATNRQTDFTSSGTWTAPSGVYSAQFLVVGAGGGGGGTTQLVTEYSISGGGGGGAVKQINLSVTPGTSYTVTIGAKGTGGSGAAAGGSGGFSEVLNGATSLIKCFGGAGGSSTTGAGVEVFATASQTLAGGGGKPNSGVGGIAGGGGGGAFPIIQGYGTSVGTILTSGEGSPGKSSTTGAASDVYTTGAMGINGYGAGGGGGLRFVGTLTSTAQGGSQYAGNGAVRSTAGVTNGGAAVANTGCGGGGSSAMLNATATTGGNGADGLVRVVYFA